MTSAPYPAPSRGPVPAVLPVLPFLGWVCGTCGGGGIASDGSTCPDCNGHGHGHGHGHT